jgi:hypothetical protein
MSLPRGNCFSVSTLVRQVGGYMHAGRFLCLLVNKDKHPCDLSNPVLAGRYQGLQDVHVYPSFCEVCCNSGDLQPAPPMGALSVPHRFAIGDTGRPAVCIDCSVVCQSQEESRLSLLTMGYGVRPVYDTVGVDYV